MNGSGTLTMSTVRNMPCNPSCQGRRYHMAAGPMGVRIWMNLHLQVSWYRARPAVSHATLEDPFMSRTRIFWLTDVR